MALGSPTSCFYADSAIKKVVCDGSKYLLLSDDQAFEFTPEGKEPASWRKIVQLSAAEGTWKLHGMVANVGDDGWIAIASHHGFTLQRDKLVEVSENKLVFIG